MGKYIIYNVYHPGLFHNKLPSRTFEKILNAKEARKVKQMISKEIVTIIIVTSAYGRKLPLSMIGKSKNPYMF